MQAVEYILKDIISFFAIVSIIITLLGVYSSITLDTERRQKEVAIRKVNGAGIRSIIWLFARLYLILLMVTAAITPERIRLNRYLLFMFSTSFFFFFILHKNSRMFPPGLSVLIILLSRIICPSWILQTGIGTFVIPPCLIPVQIGK